MLSILGISGMVEKGIPRWGGGGWKGFEALPKGAGTRTFFL